jgi:heterodisulfide reductase subunit C
MENIKLKNIFFEQDGDKILKCIQCGTCSASCPLTDHMENAPRELFALIRDGNIIEALTSQTLWYCVSCYKCMTRCPKEIPVTELIYTLKRLALKEGFAPKNHKTVSLNRSFSNCIDKNGLVTESTVMRGYGMKHPLDVVKKVPLALKMLKRDRLEILSQKTKNPAILKRMFEMGEEE